MTPAPSSIVQHYLGSPWLIGGSALIDVIVLVYLFRMRPRQAVLVASGMNLAVFLIGRYVLPIIFSSYYLGIATLVLFTQHHWALELSAGMGFIGIASIVVGCHGLLSATLSYYIKLFFIEQAMPMETYPKPYYQWIFLNCLVSNGIGLLALADADLSQWLDFNRLG